MLSKNLFDEKTLEVNSISDYLTVTTPLPQYLPYPRFLLDTDLSHTAKLLYTLLLDRATLSQKNNWMDECVFVYVIFPLSSLSDALRCSTMSIKRALRSLEDADLIERRRGHIAVPNNIFVKVPTEQKCSSAWNDSAPCDGTEMISSIRTIFEQYVNTDTGANGLSKYLETHGFQKLARQNGTSPLFSATLIRAILKNPVYCGKIAFGRRKLEKIHGTRNEYHQVPQENYLLVDGLHEGIVSEELWNAAQVKLLAQSKRYEPVNRSKTEQAHLLSALVKCPICGAGMYSSKCTKRKKDGTPYKSFSYYSCKHRKMQRGQKCDFNKQIQEEVLDNAVVEVIIKLVSNPKFAAMMQEKINSKVDTTAIEQEIAAAEKQLRQYYSVKSKLMDEIDTLDPDDRHYIMRKSDLDERLYKMYDKIEGTENQLVTARAKKQAIEADKITGDNIYKVLVCFEKLYNVMNPVERKKLMEHLISEIQIYPERQPNGQWLKSIKFRLPIIENGADLCLDNGSHVEVVSCYTKTM